MESTITTTEQQTLATTPIMNSSSRRKQSKPNRLEHIIVDPPAPLEPIVSSLTQYHVAAEQQQESALIDDDSDRISLNCEDGSLSSQSPNEHYAMEDILNRSRRSSHPTHRTNDKTNFEENIDSNEQQEDQQQIGQTSQTNFNVLDFSLKFDDNNKNLFNSSNRSRALNPTGKSRSLKRKHPSNGNLETKNVNSNGPTRIFHADAFCSICRKEFCNKYFLKTHLANKHGIFEQQSLASSLSTPSMIGLTTPTDLNSDPTNLQHSFTMVSTLLQNSQEELSSSPRSDFVENVRTNDQDDVEDDDEETGDEFSSIRQQMNGVIAGDDDDDQQIDRNPLPDDQQTNDDDDDDEQDGTNPTSFIHLPQQIATILRNENSKRNSLSLLNENDDDEQDQQEINANSPTNSLDYSQQQQQASSSSQSASTTTTITTGAAGSATATTNIATTNLPRQSSAKLPEDFCDICQKHFCNKYYLRKHKLDVHGVQTDCNIKPYKRIDNNSLANKNSVASSSASQLSSTIQLPSTFSAVTFNPSTVQQSLGILLNPIFSPLVQSQSVTGGETTSLISNKRRYTDNSNESSSSSTMATSNLGKTTFPPSLLTVASDVAQVFANQLASVANNSSSSSTNSTTSVGNGGSGTTTTTTKSQISTCHLCGKKFQTNDYLQLHLMNKHQITTDLSTIESIEQRTKSSNLIKSSNGSVNSSTVKKIKLETNETATTSNAINVNLVKTSSTVASPIDPNGSIIPGIVDTYFAAKMADRVSCDICHKQVCNKYFLKTHKLKVHGVGPDSSTVSSSSSSTTNQLNNGEGTDDLHDQQQSRSSFDGSPPQLVVDEMNLTGNEPGVIPSPDALTASVNTFLGTTTNSTIGTTENIEIAKTTICEICSKSFPTKFLHVHMNNAHGIQQAPLIVNGTSSTSSTSTTTTTTTKTPIGSNPIKRTLSNGGNNGTNPVRLKQTPQVQLRVTCQVCKKELCNKYFLRAHMRNVHNLSVDDLRLIQPATSPKSESPSSKQTFSLSSNLLSTNENNSTSNENESNHFNGHTTDSNESESFHLPKDFTSYSLSSPLTTTATTIKSSTNDNNNNNNRLLSMQPFLVESDDDLYKDLFVPCMVYLPCRHRVTKTLEISLRLKPVDNPNSTATTPPTATASIAD